MSKTPAAQFPAAVNAEKPRRGIQSVEVGTRLLLELARHVTPMALRDLARATGMSTGKAHPYLVSYLKLGFVMQDASGRYELGPLALQLGLARLKRLDPVREAAPLIADLAEGTGQSVGLAVWGNQGPTIVRLEEPVHPMHVNLRIGSVMALASTATGRLFAAFMPPKVVEQALADNTAHRGGQEAAAVRAQLEPMLAETRLHGLSRSIGQPIAGIDAFCAPVFDSSGLLVMGITAMGPSATFDTDWNGTVAQPLKRCAEEVSLRLGMLPRG
jgi:DNA-binding IclR family transcriptional regulator